MTAIYDRDQIRFQYPDNWRMEEDPPSGVPRTISVTAPSGAFWSIALFSQRATNEQQLLEQYIETLDSEYAEVEHESIVESIGKATELSARDIQFFCLDLLIRSRILTVKHGPYWLLVCWQAEDREFDALEPVFRAMTISCLAGN